MRLEWVPTGGRGAWRGRRASHMGKTTFAAGRRRSLSTLAGTGGHWQPLYVWCAGARVLGGGLLAVTREHLLGFEDGLRFAGQFEYILRELGAREVRDHRHRVLVNFNKLLRQEIRLVGRQRVQYLRGRDGRLPVHARATNLYATETGG